MFKPDKPKFGDIVETESDRWVPWVGGAPAADWSGLSDVTPISITATRFRPTRISDSTKCMTYRTKGMETPFKRGDDLLVFSKKVKDHLESYGLDTVSYLPNPADPSQVVSVVENHNLFELKDGGKQGNTIKETHFDMYSHADDREAKKFLLNSVDKDLEVQLYQNCDDEDSFVTMWLNLVYLVRSVSMSRFQAIEERLKRRKITEYAGENVESLATDYHNDYEELNSGRMYDHKLTLHMLNAFMKGCGTGDHVEDFRSPLRTIRDQLDEKLLAIRHMSYDDQHKAMQEAGLDVKEVLRRVKSKYRTLLENKMWPAAVHARDSKGLHRTYGRVHKAEANALVKGDPKAFEPKWTMVKKKGNKPSKPSGKPKSNRNNGRRSNSKKGKKDHPANAPPPGPGESEIKYTDGEKRYWCAKCNRWTLSHTTEQHKSKEALKADGPARPSAGMARVSFDMHPTINMAIARIPQAVNPVNTSSIRTIRYAGILVMTLVLGVILYLGSRGATKVPEIATNPGWYLDWSFDAPARLALHLLTFVTQNGPMLFAGLMSGVLGFGTATYVYKSVKPKEVKTRVRRGKAAVKQARRWWKAQHKVGSRRSFVRSRVAVPERDRLDLVHADRFRNLARPLRYEAPIHRRIRLLKKLIDDLDEEIRSLRRLLQMKEDTRSRYKKELLRLKWNTDATLRNPKGLMTKMILKDNGAPKKPSKKNILGTTIPDVLSTRRRRRSASRVKSKQLAADRDQDPEKFARDVAARERRRRRNRNKNRNKAKRPGPVYPIDSTPSPSNWNVFLGNNEPDPPINQDAVCFVTNVVNLNKISSVSTISDPNEAILFDSGANCCITNRRDDFTGDFSTESPTSLIDGIGKGLAVKGTGTVAWTFKADNGMYRTLRLRCYYVPSANQRICSLQMVLEKYINEEFTMDREGLHLSGDLTHPPLTIKATGPNKLPLAFTEDFIGYDSPEDDHCPTPKVNAAKTKERKPPKNPLEPLTSLSHHGFPALTVPDNINLSAAEKELLYWHHRLGHISMKRVQWLFRQGVLASSEKSRGRQRSAAKLTRGPLCAGCQYAKQRLRSSPGSVKKTIPDVSMALKKNTLYPGQRISADHFVCKPLGRLLNTYGKEADKKKYTGGSIWVDHASGAMFVGLQAQLNSHETLHCKKMFEDKWCASHGVVPQEYLSDSGTSFTCQGFQEHLERFHQHHVFSGVGAHHSNGIAERNIGTLMSTTRAMMHHAALHWPEVADVGLWPLATLYACDILNSVPRPDTGRSPLELFSRKTLPPGKLRHFRVWGCPVYVLDTALQNGNKLPRFTPPRNPVHVCWSEQAS